MIVMSISGLSLSYGHRIILDNVSMIATHKDKVGIVGVNGAGKTTLFRLITGMEKPDKGEIFISKDITVGYLKQEDGKIENSTIYDAVLNAYSNLIEMEKKLETLNEVISLTPPGDELEKYIHKYSELTDSFKLKGGYEYKSRAKGILIGLGFLESEFSSPVSKLSGGQRTKLMMANLLGQEPDILLLDEPTNHLDMASLSWLEEFINNYAKTVIVISHDRYFLDKICNGIFEIENTTGTYYKGNYSSYINKKNTDKELLQRKFNNQQKEIKRLEEFIEQQQRWNRERNIIAAESRMKAIERIEKIESPKRLPPKINMEINNASRSGNDILSVKNLTAGYGDLTVFNNVSFEIKRGEKLFILGPNGCGKSTLLKVLTLRLPSQEGEFFFGHNVDYGYYDQDFISLNPNNTIYDEILSMDDVISQTEIRNILASFLFKGDDVFKKISVLSGGEKSRILLSKLIISKPNLLILDEPTNHLDINSREVLEDLLIDFDGTIICVSHDRYFVNKLSTRILEFSKQNVFNFPGNYKDFLNYKKNLDLSVQEKNNEYKGNESRETFLSSKEQKSKERRLLKKISDTESEISKIENRLAEIDEEMNKPEIVADHVSISSLYEEKKLLDEKLEELLIVWEELCNNSNY